MVISSMRNRAEVLSYEVERPRKPHWPANPRTMTAMRGSTGRKKPRDEGPSQRGWEAQRKTS
eukprot:6226420-Prymnesium_polylepis.1